MAFVHNAACQISWTTIMNKTDFIKVSIPHEIDNIEYSCNIYYLMVLNNFIKELNERFDDIRWLFRRKLWRLFRED